MRFVSNGRRLLLLLTLKLEDGKRYAKAGLTRLKRSPLLASLGFVALLSLLAMSLAACGTTSTPPSVGPRNPLPPPTKLSESPPDYLSNAQRFISESRKKLQELIQKPAN